MLFRQTAMTPLVQACPLSQCAWCRAMRQQGIGCKAHSAAWHLVMPSHDPSHCAALLTLDDSESTIGACGWIARRHHRSSMICGQGNYSVAWPNLWLGLDSFITTMANRSQHCLAFRIWSTDL